VLSLTNHNRSAYHQRVIQLWLRRGVLIIGIAAIAVHADAATITVRSGDNLQAALNAAQPGDTLMLEAGATFIGNFVLPVKSGTANIVVRSAAPDGVLPGSNVRMTPAYAARLPKIQSVNAAAALRAAAGAHNWQLRFLEFPATLLGYGEIVRIGEGSTAQTSLSQVPYDIEIDRVYVHGDPLYGQKRGIALNGRTITIHNSYISDIKAVGFDSQAIGGWNGPGPFTIVNNYLEAAGENFILGGSDPAIPNLVSENVIVRYNYMSKPMSWRSPIIPMPASVTAVALPGAGVLPPNTYTYQVVAFRQVGGGTIGRSPESPVVQAAVPAGTSGAVQITWGAVPNATEYRVYTRDQSWSVATTSFVDTGTSAGAPGPVPSTPPDTWQVKNVFELKNARHVTVEFNVFENNWDNAQPGYAILFTPRNQDGGCTWCVVADVTFQFNIVRNSPSGINLSGYDSPNPSAQTTGVRIRHNLVYGLTQSLGGAGWFFLIGDQPRDVIIDHNTADFDGSTAVYVYGGTSSAPKQITGFQFTNNALRHGTSGINGANTAWGNNTIATYFPGGIVLGNWLQGGTASRYPAGNYFTGTFATEFVNAAAGDYRPSATSILLRAATDGTNIGADMSTLLPETAHAIEGVVIPPPAPSGFRIVK
jgi:hypothetical protein